MRKPDYKWGLLAMLSAAYLLAQGTRQTYGAVLPQIGLDFASSGGSDTQLGLVGGIFTLVFGIMGPFAGFAADTLQRKWLVVGGLALFSTGILSSGFAVGVGSLLLAYGVVNGLGQALMPPAISSLIGQYHVKTRATAFSIYQSAIYAGIVGCSCLSGWLAGLGDGGWRSV